MKFDKKVYKSPKRPESPSVSAAEARSPGVFTSVFIVSITVQFNRLTYQELNTVRDIVFDVPIFFVINSLFEAHPVSNSSN